MADVKTTLSYLANRLHEKSTYLMLPILLSAYGINTDDATYQLISQFGIAISGLLLVLLPESGVQRTTTLVDYLAKRLTEPTTYAAIPLLLGMIGMHIDDALVQKISTIGIAVGGLLAMLLSEQSSTPPGIPIVEPTSDPSATRIPVLPYDDRKK